MFFSYLFDLRYQKSGGENVFNGIFLYALFYGVFNIRKTCVDVVGGGIIRSYIGLMYKLIGRIGIIGEELVSAYAFYVFFCE